MDDSGRPLSAKEKRQEQLKRWEKSATDVEPPVLQNQKPRVKFHDGAVFLAACSSGDLEEVKVLLEKGADINFANIDGLTALHQACIDGNLDVVEFLVEQGAEIDQEDNEGWTPLHAAASCDFMDIAKYLVRKGANVVAVNSEGEVPLDIAEEDEMRSFLEKEVTKQGVDIEMARNSERERMTIDARQLLNTVSRGESPTLYRHPTSGATALHVAAAKGYINVIKILLQAGMDVNLQDNDGWTPLHAASHWSQEEAAKLLADRNADFNICSKLGQRPCDVADEDMLSYLEELAENQEPPAEDEKKSNFIEPPPFAKDSVKHTTEEISHQEIRITEKKTHEVNRVVTSEKDHATHRVNALQNDDDNSFSSEDDGDSSSSSEAFKPAQKETASKVDDSLTQNRFSQSLGRIGSANNIDSAAGDTPLRLKHSSSSGNFSFSGRRNSRPASLHITGTEAKDLQPPILSATDRPIAAAQPIQASKSTNGPVVNPVTPSERNYDIKEDAPNTWRAGLRKTGSFDKTRPAPKNFPAGSYTRQQDGEKSSLSRSSDEIANAAKSTARVAPLIDGRSGIRNRQADEGDSILDRYNFQRSSYPRTGTGRSTTAAPTFRRSLNDTTAKQEEEENPPREPSSFATAFSIGSGTDLPQDRRRSHLQPVRDEEAEAKRKARSRRERQSRRSTQGVTLDVVEEAKKSIENKKRERTENAASGKKAEEGVSYESTPIPHTDSNILSNRRLYGNTTSAGSNNVRPVNLPSAYIPSHERTMKTAPLNSNNPPTINFPEHDNDELEKQMQDETNADDDKNLLSSSQQRKSAAQLRRRQRKERRSTGLPELRNDAAPDVPSDEDDSKNDDLELKSERLRATASHYQSIDRSSKYRSGLNTDNDLSKYSSDKTETKDYKKLYEEERSENKRLQRDLNDANRKIGELEAKLSQVGDAAIQQSAVETERRKRRTLEKKLNEMERELKNHNELRTDNQRLKDENGALIRVISKLSK